MVRSGRSQLSVGLQRSGVWQEGETVIGSEELSPTPDIVLSGAGVLPLHCKVTLHAGTATVHPCAGAQCWLNTVLIDKPAKLSQGTFTTWNSLPAHEFSSHHVPGSFKRGVKQRLTRPLYYWSLRMVTTALGYCSCFQSGKAESFGS